MVGTHKEQPFFFRMYKWRFMSHRSRDIYNIPNRSEELRGSGKDDHLETFVARDVVRA